MSETTSKVLEDRIVAIVERVKALAAERDVLRGEIDAMKSRLDQHERENDRLRAVLEEAVRELRQE